MKSFKEIMEESKRIDQEMESLMQSIGYESLEAAAKDAEEFLKLIGGAENVLGVKRLALYRKLKGEVKFTKLEKEKIKEVLNIDIDSL